MAKLTKKLFFKNKDGVQKSISIYDEFDNLGKDYLTIAVNEESYGAIQVSPVEYTTDTPPKRIVTHGSSELIIKTSDGKEWSANYHAEDPNLIVSGINTGVKVIPPEGKGGTYFSYGINVPTVWEVAPRWDSIGDDHMISRFKVTIKPHVFLSDIEQFRCIISTDSLGTDVVSVQTISVDEKIFFIDISPGTYYFRVLAEDNNAMMLYTTPPLGPVTSSWNTLSDAFSYFFISAVDSTGKNTEIVYFGQNFTCTYSNKDKRWYFVGAGTKHPFPGESSTLYTNIKYCADFCTCNSNACPCDVDLG